MMIYFKKELKDKADALREIKEYADAFNDISRIENTIENLYTDEDYLKAQQLDQELIARYCEIQVMLAVANTMPKIKGLSINSSLDNTPQVVKNLNQDRFGIYAHILLKSKNIAEIKDFIDYVVE